MREDQRAQASVEEELAPAGGHDVVPEAGDRVAPQCLDRRLQTLGDEDLPPPRVHLELLDPLGQRAEVLKQGIAGVTRVLQVPERAIDQHAVGDRAEHHEGADDQHDPPRQPAEVDGAAAQDRRVHGHGRNVGDRPAYRHDIVGQRAQDARDADLLQVSQRSRQHLAAEVAAEVAQGALREVGEQHPGDGVGDHLRHEESREGGGEETGGVRAPDERGVHQGDERGARRPAEQTDHGGGPGQQPRAPIEERQEAHPTLIRRRSATTPRGRRRRSAR